MLALLNNEVVFKKAFTNKTKRGIPVRDEVMISCGIPGIKAESIKRATKILETEIVDTRAELEIEKQRADKAITDIYATFSI